jgi:hypothetical protein
VDAFKYDRNTQADSEHALVITAITMLTTRSCPDFNIIKFSRLLIIFEARSMCGDADKPMLLCRRCRLSGHEVPIG